MLRDQTAGKGINIYTNGEMLPANAYPAFKATRTWLAIIGRMAGAAAWNAITSRRILLTPLHHGAAPSYKDRIFSTGVVGWTVWRTSIPPRGAKDFAPVIEKALALGGWSDDEPAQTLLTGFARNAVLSHAGEIVEAVKSGKIKHFFLVGGCDGAKAGRNYYTEFAEKSPQDSLVLTLACGKYRFIKKDLGTVAGLPRLLDVGQCNDAYSVIQIAAALASASSAASTTCR
jgi:hydroxylamine reductase